MALAFAGGGVHVLGAPLSLAGLGLKETDLAVAAAQAAGQAYANPREVTVDGALAVLRAAYEGGPPEFADA
jgi:maleylacetate reductase